MPRNNLSPEAATVASLTAFACLSWSGYKPSAHHRLIADALKKVAIGTCKRLMVFMPPRHGKSMLTSEYFPAWYLGRNPKHQVITATYAQGLADDFGRKVRNIMAGDIYHEVFPHSTMSDDSQAANRLHTTQGGAYYAVGAGGPITGRGAHLLVIDDPIKGREDAESETMRNRLKDWYTSVARTRLMPGGAIVIIQTRWHEDDLAGWLLREHSHEGWEIINLPAIAEVGDQINRIEGEALWPSAYPLKDLESIRLAIGPRDWASLYQQRPSAAEGSIFKRENWRQYQTVGSDPKETLSLLGIKKVIQAWDTAFKTKETNDYSVCVTVGVSKNRYYVLDVWRHRVEFPDLSRAMVSEYCKWNPHVVVVEDTAAGQSLIQSMRRETRLPILPVKADRDKVSRAHAVTPTHEAGLVFIPPHEHWCCDFEDELASFPTAPHDDQVDAFVHAMAKAISLGEVEEGMDSDEPDPNNYGAFESGLSAYGWLA